jgi:hypothetical protein
MSELNKVVAHYLDGKLLKGTTQDFVANRDVFHMLPADGSAVQTIRCRDLKGLYFVRELDGNPNRTNLRGFVERDDQGARGNKLAVRFKDGELLCGYSLSYTADRAGFFMLPADQGCNNQRIYVVRSSTVAVKAGAAAEALAKQVLDSAA